MVTVEKCKEATQFIKFCSPRIGSFFIRSKGDGKGPGVFPRNLIEDMESSEPSSMFPKRFIEPVIEALSSIYQTNFGHPRIAVDSAYLATRFEFYLRLFSGCLTADGLWISEQSMDKARDALKSVPSLSSKMIENLRNSKRISSVSVAYKLAKLNESETIGQFLSDLDDSVFSEPMKVCTGDTINDLGDRIECLRHPLAHGLLGDVSSEVWFYIFLTGLAFYSQNLKQ